LHQIYITAIVTTLFAFFAIGAFIKWRAQKEDLKLLVIVLCIELPMAILFFYYVRMGALDWLVQLVFNKDTNSYKYATLFYAPLTEEPAKLLPLLIPWVYKRITDKNFVFIAMAIGLGFGIGEIWLVASFVAKNPAYANLPWYMFTGFINERFMVCVCHGAFNAFALSRLHKKFYLGVMGAMLLHFFANFPIFLAAIDLGGFGKGAWQVILGLWVVLYFIAMLLLLTYLYYGNFKFAKFFFGNSTCPECGFVYPGPIFGLNAVTKRYERCPNCKKWHWVTKFKKDEKA
jgi:ssDNA-binding Zn-finger/Zn-ribbon topoisomerase 1